MLLAAGARVEVEEYARTQTDAIMAEVSRSGGRRGVVLAVDWVDFGEEWEGGCGCSGDAGAVLTGRGLK